MILLAAAPAMAHAAELKAGVGDVDASWHVGAASGQYASDGARANDQEFDPHGHYVRRWVGELHGVDPRYVHEPVKDPAGLPDGYPAPIVEHGEERREALARLERMRNTTR